MAVAFPAPISPLRRRARAFATGLAASAVLAVALALLMLWLLWRLNWPHTRAAGDPAFGISYSCNQAEYLLLEDTTLGLGAVPDDRPGRVEWCAARLDDILAATGARYLRLSAEWSQVEPREGEFDFTLIDALLATAQARGARVLLTVGVKAQRHPEFYVPQWVLDSANLGNQAVISDNPYLREQALAMVTAVVQHVAGSPAIDSWSADNEPYVTSGRDVSWKNWELGRDFVAAESAIIRANDPAGRPILVNHGQHFVQDRRWEDALADGDILGTSIYPFRNQSILGVRFVAPILEIGPFGPNYAYQARRARQAGKPYWITEMQAEPWAAGDVHAISPANPSPNFSPGKFDRSIDYARRTGADRVYLWGSEWWLYQRERYGDGSWLEQARAVLAPPGALAPQGGEVAHTGNDISQP
ncbi:MAG: beta-galactosidase [Chloroflexi bacterium]|nr:beta-galactosidase [Chloroflexota bacterium]